MPRGAARHGDARCIERKKILTPVPVEQRKRRRLQVLVVHKPSHIQSCAFAFADAVDSMVGQRSKALVAPFQYASCFPFDTNRGSFYG
jgi:hypothetical protein